MPSSRVILVFFCALCAALLPAGVDAQEDVARLTHAGCAPSWWSEGAMTSAVFVELAMLGVTSGEASEATIEIAIALRCDEADARSAGVSVRAPHGAVERAISLEDVEPMARIRTLALAVHDAVAEALALPAPLERDARGGSAITTTEPATTEITPAMGPAGDAAALADPSRPRSPDPRSGGADPRASESPRSEGPDPRASEGRASEAARTEIELGVPLVVLVGPPALGGGIAAGVALPIEASPLSLFARLRFAYAEAFDALGSVFGVALDGAVGARASVLLLPLRLALELGAAPAWLHLEGQSALPDVISARRDAFGLSLEAHLRGSLALTPELGVALALGVRGYVVGLAARADPEGRVVLDLTGAVPSASIELLWAP